MRKTGEYITLGEGKHFIPFILPPKEPHFIIDMKMIDLYGRAMRLIGILDEKMRRIPDKERFLKAYVLKEAILTSEIEGIHTTLIDVLSYPYNLESNIENGANNVKDKNIQLVMNYGDALEKAVSSIKNDGMPIVSRVIKEAHAKLLKGEGDRSSPGEFRKLQVQVGSLMPAPAHLVPGLMSDLEKYINNDNSLPSLIKAGLAHVQFEMIHPFLDGNGRIGRLLIILILINEGLLSEPLIYPSYFFKKFHAKYYATLDAVRTDGDYEGWIEYYLQALAESAKDAIEKAEKLEELESEVLNTSKNSNLFVRSYNDATEMLNYLFKNPVINITRTSNDLNKRYNSIKDLVNKFEKLNIITKNSKVKRNKAYVFSKYIEILS